MKGIYVDNDAKVIDEHFAIVKTNKRRRNRFPENSVQLVDSAQLAIDGADAQQNMYAARVLGPSRSSEGLRIFYLVEWLD